MLKYLAVHDCGRIMNPLSASGQIKGAATMGIGMALHEDLLYDRAQRTAADSPATTAHRVMTHHGRARDRSDVHRKRRRLRPVRREEHRRSGQCACRAAVGNAIFNATGHRMKELAHPPRQVWRSIRMKALSIETPRSAAGRDFAEQARANGSQAMFAGGGSDLLGMVKDRIVTPDVLIHLKAIKGLDQVTAQPESSNIGGLITLDALSHHPLIRSDTQCWPKRPESVATPQIRNVGTLAGNVCQRPWCWYFRNGFPCFKAGGNTCFSITGENQFHAIFGGGPSFIVHPSDTAPALVALDAKFRIVGPWASARFRRRISSSCRSRTRRARTRSATMRCWRRSSFRQRAPARAAPITKSWIAKLGLTRW